MMLGAHEQMLTILDAIKGNGNVLILYYSFFQPYLLLRHVTESWFLACVTQTSRNISAELNLPLTIFNITTSFVL